MTLKYIHKPKASSLFNLSWFIISVTEHIIFEPSLLSEVVGARWRLVGLSSQFGFPVTTIYHKKKIPKLLRLVNHSDHLKMSKEV
jgi:hypothetical protein